MPAVLKVDPRRRVVLTTFHGHVGAEELVQLRNNLLENPRFNDEFADVIDLSGVAESSIDEQALRAFANNPSLFSAKAPHVFIAPAEKLHQLMLKYKELVRESRPNLYVVRTLAEARTLLDSLGFQL